MITDEALQEIVSRSVESQETCRELINCANENGGADNITAIVCRFVNASSEAPIAFVETEVPLVDATAHVNA
jgi:serine/threonine protein phosphatase PrpC